MSPRLALAGWLTLCPGSAAAGDEPPADAVSGRGQAIDAFVEQARRATDKYHDRAAAIVDGYRPIGEDFPGMGEHWIHIGLVLDGRYDVTHPEFLTYVSLDGVPRLLGVAYALPLLQGEEPPDEPAGRAAWHAHARSVDDETLMPHHHQSAHGSDAARLAMLHAWVWLANPEGLFAADNWAVPFLRLGFAPPAQDGSAAGKALSLLSGADAYLARAVATAVAPAAIDEGTLHSAIARARQGVASIVQGRSGAALSASELEALATRWQQLWRAIESGLPADAAESVRSLSIR